MMPDIEAELSRNAVSVNALKVVKRLTSQGYEAYLVGGCVRDLLLKRSPKDFDVATSAHPEEVRELFHSRSFMFALDVRSLRLLLSAHLTKNHRQIRTCRMPV